MPANKRTQGNGALYAAVTFVVLFIISLVVSIVFYIKSEEYKLAAGDAKKALSRYATIDEQVQMDELIGTDSRKLSRIGQLLDYLDQVVRLTIGDIPLNIPAEEKINNAKAKTKTLLDLVNAQMPTAIAGEYNPETTGLLYVIESIGSSFGNLAMSNAMLDQNLTQLQFKFKDAQTESLAKEQKLIEEKQQYQQVIDNIKEDYNQLESLLQASTQSQVQMLRTQWQKEKNKNKQLNQQLLKTNAQLAMSQEKIQLTQTKLQSIVPPPDTEAAAFDGDGKIILVDNQTQIVRLDLGIDDGVYQGLTFAVYNRNQPIPKNGKGKAEIEIYQINRNTSAAKIINYNKKNPIVTDDIIANLIWDKNSSTVFAVTGEFDIDDDSKIDYQGQDKVKSIIEQWGGIAVDRITVDTDFVVMGQAPHILKKPTYEETAIDPLAMQKYQKSIDKFNNYKKIQSQAKDLSVPLFNLERFLYFVGYKTLSKSDRSFSF